MPIDPNLGYDPVERQGYLESLNPALKQRVLSNLSIGGDMSIPPAMRQSSNQVSQTSQPETSDPQANFNNQLLDMIKQYQQLGTKPFQDQMYNAQTAQNNAVLNPNLEGLEGASTSQINSVINSGANALNPTIQGADQGMRTFSEQIKGAGDYLSRIQDMQVKSQETQNKQRDDARALVNDILTTTDLTSLQGLDPEQIADLEKTAGYPKGFLNNAITYKSKAAAQAQWSEPYMLGGNYVQKNQSTGEIRTASNPDAGGGSGGITPYQVLQTKNQIEDNLRQNPAVQAFGQLVNFGVPQVIDDFNSGQANSVTDTILMRALAKVTDPTTGVREEEYRTFDTAIGALNRIFVVPQAWVGRGRLNATGREQMIKQVQDRFKARLNDYKDQYKYYQGQATQLGVSIPPPYIVSGLGVGSTGKSTSSGTSGVTSSGLKYTVTP